MPLLHRLIHRWDNDGPYSLALKVYRTLRNKLIRRAPSPEARPAGAPHFVHPFDLAHGTDTSGFIPGDELAGDQLTRNHSAFYTTAYYAVAPSTLRQALDHLPIPPEAIPAFTFVVTVISDVRTTVTSFEGPFAVNS